MGGKLTNFCGHKKTTKVFISENFLPYGNYSPLNISSVQQVIFNMQCTNHVILLESFVLFLRLFQALLMLALDMMDDDNDVVMESPREDFPSLIGIYSINTGKKVGFILAVHM